MVKKRLFSEKNSLSLITFLLITIFISSCSPQIRDASISSTKNIPNPSENPNSIPKEQGISQHINANPLSATNTINQSQINQSEVKNSNTIKNPESNKRDTFTPRFKNLSPLYTEKISISYINEDYRAVLQAIAHAGGFNLVILPEVNDSIGDNGKITANYIEMPLIDILNSICKIFDIHWKISEGTLYIALFEQKIFYLDFLTNLQSIQYTIGGDVLGGGSGGGGGENIITPLTGNFKIEGQIDKSVTDIFTEVESMVSIRLGITPRSGATTATAEPPPKESDDFIRKVKELSVSIDGKDGKTKTEVTEKKNSVTKSASNTTSKTPSNSLSNTGAGWGENGSYFLNRQTGILMVKARPSALNDIEKLIDIINKKYNRYVIIDARILEIELNNNYKLGIDWRTIEAGISKNSIRDSKITANFRSAFDATSGIFNLSLLDRYFDMNILVNSLQEFGQVRTLSNPRLKAMNGQTAVMSIGQSISYLKEISREYTSGVESVNYDVQVSSVFDGILLGVTPIIHDNGKVNLHVVPIKSELIKIEERTFGESAMYSLPTVNLREASTVLRLNDGEIAILGGFIKERKERIDSGMPVLQKLPVAGRLFRHEVEQNKLVEMVILLNVKVFYGE